MKFTLKFVDKIKVGGRTEERYHYESGDGKLKCSFYAGKAPWTWCITGNLTNAERLIEKFCEQGAKNSHLDFQQRVKELVI